MKKITSIVAVGILLLSVLSCKPDEVEKKYGKAGTVLAEEKIWSEYVKSNRSESGSTSIWWLSGDTLVDGKIWKKAYGASPSYYLSDSVFWGLYRQEGQKVWHLYDGWQKTEQVCIFDFDKTVGDRIALAFDVVAEVTRVFDTVLPGTDGISRRCMQIQEKIPEERSPDLWVEGIGSLSFGFCQSVHTPGHRSVLLCCEENGTSVYRNAEYDTCYMEE